MATGHCNCGAVAYELDDTPTDVIICHCSICRRATGANGIAVALVEISAFRWLRGETSLTCWRKPDGDWLLAFCSICGSPMPAANDDTRMFVPAGSLNADVQGQRVAHHIWVRSKACWDVIGDDGKQHNSAFNAEG